MVNLNNVSFKGNLAVIQTVGADSKLAKLMTQTLDGVVENMPKGDEFRIKMTKSAFITEYFPGVNAPIGAEKIECLQQNAQDVVTFAEDLGTSLKGKEFNIKDFVSKTRIFLCKGLNDMVAGSKGLVRFLADDNAYKFEGSGEVVKINNMKSDFITKEGKSVSDSFREALFQMKKSNPEYQTTAEACGNKITLYK